MHQKNYVWISRFHALVILLGVACLATPARAASPVWLKVQTDDFVAYSDAPQKDVVDFCVRYTAYRQVFREIFASPGHRIPPTTLVLFRRNRDFTNHIPPSQGLPDVLSYSVVVDGTGMVALSLAGNTDLTLANTIEFETTWGLRRCGYYVPLWMAQGTGKVLSTLQVKNGSCRIGTFANLNDQPYFGSGKELTWQRFFAVTNSSPEYIGRQSGVYHSQAWALMHWILLKDGATRDRFETMAHQLGSKSALEAIQAVMNTEPANLSYAIRLHLNGFRKPREIAYNEAKVRGSLVVTNAQEAEVLTWTGTLLAAAGRKEESDLQLYRARQLAPELPAVKEAWARRARQENDPDEAIRLYREAIDNDTKNPTTYLHSATARLNAGSPENLDYPGARNRNAELAIEEIRTALKLNPGYSEAYQLLGRAFYVLPTVTEEHVKELDAGVSRGEIGESVRYSRAMLWQRLGRYEESRTDFQQMLDDPDTPGYLQNTARVQMKRLDYLAAESKVQALAERGEIEEARKLFAQIDASDLDDFMAPRYRKLRESLAKSDSQQP